MGSCVSLSKGKPGGLVSKPDRAIVIPSSPIKGTIKPVSDASFDFTMNSSDDFGSKDVTFFDTRVWLDSDSEDDDFYSVNGDFTPSRGSNTPVHHRFSAQIHKTLPMGNLSSHMPEPSPTGMKPLKELFQYSVREKPDVYEQPSQMKPLRELFQYSVREKPDVYEQQQILGTHNNGNGKAEEVTPTILDNVLTKSAQSTPPYISRTNPATGSERTANGAARFYKDASFKSSARCCLPSMTSRSITSEMKKRMGQV